MNISFYQTVTLKYKNLITEAIIHNKADHYSLICRYRKKQYYLCEG